jgi:hypothetical protein
MPKMRYEVSYNKGETKQSKQHHMQLGSYKDGKEDNYAGWEVEKNFAPTPLGGWWVKFKYHKKKGLKLAFQEAE